MKKTKILYLVLGFILIAIGLAVYKQVVSKSKNQPVVQEEPTEILPLADTSIRVTALRSRTENNSVNLEVSGLGGKYASVAYELTYESKGLIKGVNSGSKPIDVNGKDAFEREVYLGTCSRNVCRPDLGVKQVSVVLEFTDTGGKKSQFSQDYDL